MDEQARVHGRDGPLPTLTLGDLPENRRRALLWRLAGPLVAEHVRERSPWPCRVRSTAPEIERNAVLGDDGRYHLFLDGNPTCRVRRHRGRGNHVQSCKWWTDQVSYRINPPLGTTPDDAARGYGARDAAWDVTFTDVQIDPGFVPGRKRCPIDVTNPEWPPYQSPTSPKGRIRAALIDLAGPHCHACGSRPGADIDHDNFTGLVRGLLCGPCNTGVDGCPHLAGCAWAEYLQAPPAAALGLRYPGHDATLRRARAKLAFWGFDPA